MDTMGLLCGQDAVEIAARADWFL